MSRQAPEQQRYFLNCQLFASMWQICNKNAPPSARTARASPSYLQQTYDIGNAGAFCAKGIETECRSEVISEMQMPTSEMGQNRP
jgi:hypothetical protein